MLEQNDGRTSRGITDVQIYAVEKQFGWEDQYSRYSADDWPVFGAMRESGDVVDESGKPGYSEGTADSVVPDGGVQVPTAVGGASYQ